MKVVTVAQMRELERRAIEESDIKGSVLMDRAGQGVADAARRIAEAAGFINSVVHIIAGRGNNGGDAFVAARILKESGMGVEVWIAGRASQITGDALTQLTRLKAAGVKPIELPLLDDWIYAIREPFYGEVIVDGVLGTGISGPPRGPAAGAIQYINSQSNDSFIVAIDVPSGLNADSGQAEGDTVRADVTVTMGLPKTGLVEPCALDYVGTVDVVDIGLPRAHLEDLDDTGSPEFVFATDLKELFPRRHRASHKGQFGHVLLVGGAPGYSGAMTMAAQAALRSGAGLVTALVPHSIRQEVAINAPAAMVFGGPETSTGSLDASAWDWIAANKERFTSIMAGPGMTRCDATLALVERILAEFSGAIVLDADALNVLEGQAAKCKAAAGRLLLTPHPGEMARLLGITAGEVQHNRGETARKAAEMTGGVVALKGAGTVIAAPDRPLYISMTGNPGMATGGSGDVLAGLAGGLCAQKLTPCDAARAAVYVHGRAGDLAAWRKCQITLSPQDIVDELPFAFRDISLR